MAVHTYECLFLLDPNKSSSDWESTMGHANGIIERNGGKILVTRPFGETKLSFPIRKFRKGSYLLTYFQSEPSAISRMEHDTRLSDVVVRHLVLKLDPAIAKDILSHMNGEPDANPQNSNRDSQAL